MEPYTSMSLVDLKKAAKGRRIKQYYIMKRHQLIQLLSMPELPNSYRIEKFTIHELREQAREKGIRGFWSLHRDELVQLLYPTITPQKDYDTPQSQYPQPNQDNQVGRENGQNSIEQGGQ